MEILDEINKNMNFIKELLESARDIQNSVRYDEQDKQLLGTAIWWQGFAR